jgi:hypothetical protein
LILPHQPKESSNLSPGSAHARTYFQSASSAKIAATMVSAMAKSPRDRIPQASDHRNSAVWHPCRTPAANAAVNVWFLNAQDRGDCQTKQPWRGDAMDAAEPVNHSLGPFSDASEPLIWINTRSILYV